MCQPEFRAFLPLELPLASHVSTASYLRLPTVEQPLLVIDRAYLYTLIVLRHPGQQYRHVARTFKSQYVGILWGHQRKERKAKA